MFRRFFISYIAILLVPLVTGFITYYAAIDLAKTHSIETSLSVLNQSKSLLERRLAEVQSFTQQLAIHPDITNVLNLDGEAKDHAYLFWRAANNVSGYARTNDYLQNFYIYLHQYDVVLTPGFVFYRPLHYFELMQEEEGSFEAWQQSLKQTHQNETVSNQRYTNYMQTLPLNSFNDPLGTIVVSIDSRKISELFSSFVEQFGGWAVISDQEGRPIVSNGIEPSQFQSLNLSRAVGESPAYIDDDTLLISIRSNLNDWLYTAGIPEAALLQNAQFIKRITLMVTSGTLLVGLFICLWLAYRNSLPLSRLVNIFREDEQGSFQLKNEYDFLRGNISTLVKNNRLLKVEMEKQKPLIQEAFIHRLLNGEFFTLSRFEQNAEHADISLHGENGFVSLLQVSIVDEKSDPAAHDYEIQAIRIFIKQWIREEAPDLLVTALQSDKMALIFTTDKTDEKSFALEVESRLKQLIEKLEEETNIMITSSVGGFFRNLADINRSYEEAKQAILYTLPAPRGDRVLWYKPSSHENQSYYYPVHIELRLIEAIKSGEADEAIRIMDQLFEHNFTEQKLSADMACLLIEEMKATMIKAFDNRLSQQPLQLQTKWSDGVEKIMDDLKQMILTYCASVNEKKHETEVTIVQQALEYIEHHFGNPNLTVYMIAEHVNVSEKRVSQLFKEQTGEYISDYLEQIRLKKATEWLRSPDYSIEWIAEHVGYNSAHSFRRAFKRSFEMTPVQYRTMSIKQANAQIVP